MLSASRSHRAANNEKYEADQRLGELEQGKLGMQTEINHLARAFNAKRVRRSPS